MAESRVFLFSVSRLKIELTGLASGILLRRYRRKNNQPAMKRIAATARQIRASPQPGMGCDTEGVVGTEVSVVVVVDDDNVVVIIVVTFVVVTVKNTSVVEFAVDVTVAEDVEEVVGVEIVDVASVPSVSSETLFISVDVISSSLVPLNNFCVVSNSLSLSIGVARSIPVQNITKKTHLKVTAIVI